MATSPPDDPIAYLMALPRFAGAADDAYRPGLERIEALLDAMDGPHRTFKSVHVAGTNGKGSTASMWAAIASAASARVGLHTSPHLTHVTERMRVDGTPAPESWLAEAITRFHDAFERVQPSFFEATVALSFLYFAEQGVDWAAVEVGLGGRLDATNVLAPACTIITSIGLEHTDLLGNTLDAIAREKAGIIKPGVPVLLGKLAGEARRAVQEVAETREAPLHYVLGEVVEEEVTYTVERRDVHGTVLNMDTPLRRYEDLHLDLGGAHQAANAALALRAAELTLPAVQDHPRAVFEGLRAVRILAGLRGRLDVLGTDPLIVADVAHNPDSLAATLRAVHPEVEARGGTLTVLLALMRDKDASTIARLLADHQAAVIPVPLDTPRALPVEELTRILEKHDVTVAPPQPVAEGIAAFRRTAVPADGLLVTGSHYVLEHLPAQTHSGS